MIIDDISIKMLDANHSTIYRPDMLDLGYKRTTQNSSTDTSTGDHVGGLKLPPIQNNNNKLKQTDSRLWTESEFMARIEELTKEKVNQEKYIQLKEGQYSRDRQIIDDTRSFLQQDKNDANCRMEAMGNIARMQQDSGRMLNQSLQNYDNAKILTEMEENVAEDLRRQVNRINVRYQRLLKKEKASGCDQILVDAYNEGKRRLEMADEKNQRLLKKLNYYDTELNKFRERLNPAKPSKSKKSALPDIYADKKRNDDEAGNGEPTNVAAERPHVKLPAILEANVVLGDIDGIQSMCIPHPPNESNNATRSDSHVPHPPNKTKNATRSGSHVPHPPNKTNNATRSDSHVPHPPNKTNNATRSGSHVPHPPNKTNNATRADSHVPHPPNKDGKGTRRFTRKFKKGIT